jgi:hypothetical protein
LDGAHYEIDLTAAHARALRDALAPYVNAARRSPASLPQRREPVRSRPSQRAPGSD